MPLDIRKQSTPDLNLLSIFLYGFPKIGKTKESAKFPEPLILECEPRGARFVSGIDVLPIPNLQFLEQNIREILNLSHKTIIIDGMTWMLEQAAKSIGSREPRAAYKQVGDRFTALLSTILSSNKIVIATGHSRKVEDADIPGKVEIRPDLNPDLGDSIFGLFSVICYCYPSDEGSMMLTKPSDTPKRRILAGDRSGILPAKMKLSATDLMTCFRNAVQKTDSKTEQSGE